MKKIEGLLWLVSLACLVAAAYLHSRPILITVAIIWAITTATVFPLHLFLAWRKLSTVTNKGAYVVWVGCETACALALIGSFVLWLITNWG